LSFHIDREKKLRFVYTRSGYIYQLVGSKHFL